MGIQDEIKAGQERLKQHDMAARKAQADEAKRREGDPVLHKPYVADQHLDTPTFVRLENETEEEAEARKAALLAKEEAIMKAREGGTPDSRFDPDAAEAERKRQSEIRVKEDEEQRLRDEQEAALKSRIKATVATDDRTMSEADVKKAEAGKAAEAKIKAGDPSEEDKDEERSKTKSKKPKDDDGSDVLDDLLKA